MVKQFTIPCQFGQETSPVTLYIGHPEPTHHPIKFQSDWLSSAKGGTIPQDLMDTLQKLHDLSMENGADFEELCYYALISATEHSSNGVSVDDINKYADEFVKKQGDVDTQTSQQQDEPHEQATNDNKEQTNTNTASQNDIKEAEKVFNTENTKTPEQQQEIDKVISELDNFQKEQDNSANQNKQQPTINVNENKKDNVLNAENNSSNNTNNNYANIKNKDDDSLLTETYSQEDEDLLLDDDLSSF